MRVDTELCDPFDAGSLAPIKIHMHTLRRACAHTHMHIHEQLNTLSSMYPHTDTYTHTHKHMHNYIHTLTQAFTQAHMHARTCTQTLIITAMYTSICTHAYAADNKFKMANEIYWKLDVLLPGYNRYMLTMLLSSVE